MSIKLRTFKQAVKNGALLLVSAISLFSVAALTASAAYTSSQTPTQSANFATDSALPIIGVPSLLTPPPFLQPKPESNLPFTFPAIAQASGEVLIPANKHLLSPTANGCYGFKSAADLPAGFATNARVSGLGTINDLVARIGGVDYVVATCFNAQLSGVYLYNTTPANVTALPNSITFQINGVDYVGAKSVETGDLSGTAFYEFGVISSLVSTQSSPITIGISGTDGFYTSAPTTPPPESSLITYTCVDGGAEPCITNVERDFTCVNCGVGFNVWIYAGNAAAIARHDANNDTLLRVAGNRDNEKTYEINLAAWDKQYPMIGGYIAGGSPPNYLTNVIRVLGITGGSVSIPFSETDKWTIDISTVTNVLNIPADTSELTYQWQRGTEQSPTDSNWENIPNATATTYSVIATDFSGAYQHLRAIAIDVAPTSPLDNFEPMNLTSNVANFIRVSGIVGGSISIPSGKTDNWTIDLSGVINVLNIPADTSELTYQWQRGIETSPTDSNWENIPDATAATYSLSFADFPGGYQYVRVIADDVALEHPLDDFQPTVRLTSNAATAVDPGNILRNEGRNIIVNGRSTYTWTYDNEETIPGNNANKPFYIGADWPQNRWGIRVVTGDKIPPITGENLTETRRVLGIVSVGRLQITGSFASTLTVLGVNLEAMRNVLVVQPIPTELTFQWEVGSKPDGNTNIQWNPAGSSYPFTVTTGLFPTDKGGYIRVIIRDNAPIGTDGFVKIAAQQLTVSLSGKRSDVISGHASILGGANNGNGSVYTVGLAGITTASGNPLVVENLQYRWQTSNDKQFTESSWRDISVGNAAVTGQIYTVQESDNNYLRAAVVVEEGDSIYSTPRFIKGYVGGVSLSVTVTYFTTLTTGQVSSSSTITLKLVWSGDSEYGAILSITSASGEVITGQVGSGTLANGDSYQVIPQYLRSGVWYAAPVTTTLNGYFEHAFRQSGAVFNTHFRWFVPISTSDSTTISIYSSEHEFVQRVSRIQGPVSISIKDGGDAYYIQAKQVSLYKFVVGFVTFVRDDTTDNLIPRKAKTNKELDFHWQGGTSCGITICWANLNITARGYTLRQDRTFPYLRASITPKQSTLVGYTGTLFSPATIVRGLRGTATISQENRQQGVGVGAIYAVDLTKLIDIQSGNQIALDRLNFQWSLGYTNADSSTITLWQDVASSNNGKYTFPLALAEADFIQVNVSDISITGLPNLLSERLLILKPSTPVTIGKPRFRVVESCSLSEDSCRRYTVTNNLVVDAVLAEVVLRNVTQTVTFTVNGVPKTTVRVFPSIRMTQAVQGATYTWLGYRTPDDAAPAILATTEVYNVTDANRQRRSFIKVRVNYAKSPVGGVFSEFFDWESQYPPVLTGVISVSVSNNVFSAKIDPSLLSLVYVRETVAITVSDMNYKWQVGADGSSWSDFDVDSKGVPCLAELVERRADNVVQSPSQRISSTICQQQYSQDGGTVVLLTLTPKNLAPAAKYVRLVAQNTLSNITSFVYATAEIFYIDGGVLISFLQEDTGSGHVYIADVDNLIIANSYVNSYASADLTYQWQFSHSSNAPESDWENAEFATGPTYRHTKGALNERYVRVLIGGRKAEWGVSITSRALGNDPTVHIQSAGTPGELQGILSHNNYTQATLSYAWYGLRTATDTNPTLVYQATLAASQPLPIPIIVPTPFELLDPDTGVTTTIFFNATIYVIGTPAIYTVQKNYDVATFPYIQLSIYSEGVQDGGVTSAVVPLLALNQGGIEVGSNANVYSTDLSDLRTFIGSTIAVDEFTYQWQVISVASGWTNISGATNQQYTLATRYVDKSSLRVKISPKTNDFGQQSLILTSPAYSANGGLSLLVGEGFDPAGSGIGTGSKHTVDLAQFRDFADKIPQATELKYKWQDSSSGDTWADIANATFRTFTLTRAQTKVSLRVIVNGQEDFTPTITSNAKLVRLGLLTIGGSLRLNGGEIKILNPVLGQVASVDISDLNYDREGYGSVNPDNLSYQWMSGNNAVIAGATNAIYIVDVAKFGVSNPPRLGVKVNELSNPSAAKNTRTDVIQFTASIKLDLSATPRRVLGTVIDPNNDLGTPTYQWQHIDVSLYANGQPKTGDWVNIANATAINYTLPTNYDYDSPYIRLQVSGTNITFFTPEVLLTLTPDDFRLAGEVSISGGGSSGPNGGGTGVSYEVEVENVRDPEGAPLSADSLNYQWQFWHSIASGGSRWTSIASATNKIYVLEAAVTSGFLRAIISNRGYRTHNTPIRQVRGIASGDSDKVLITTNTSPSNLYYADSSNLRNIFGEVPTADVLNYQWQEKFDARGWINLPHTTTTSSGRSSEGGLLRVIVTDASRPFVNQYPPGFTSPQSAPPRQYISEVISNNGIASGRTIGLIKDTATTADFYIDLSDLETVFGDDVVISPGISNGFRFESATSVDGTWRDSGGLKIGGSRSIGNQLSVGFRLNRERAPYLRAIVRRGNTAVTSAPILAQQPSGGTVGFTSAGNRFSNDLSGLLNGQGNPISIGMSFTWQHSFSPNSDWVSYGTGNNFNVDLTTDKPITATLVIREIVPIRTVTVTISGGKRGPYLRMIANDDYYQIGPFTSAVSAVGAFSGAVGMTRTDDNALGTVFNADISALRNAFGEIPAQDRVRYQWQVATATTSGTEWEDALGGTDARYLPRERGGESADIAPYLRLVVTDPYAINPITSTIQVLDSVKQIGSLNIIITPAGEIKDSSVLSAQVIGGTVTDQLSYKWLASYGNFQTETNGAGYTVKISDFPLLGTEDYVTLQAEVVHINASNTTTTLTADFRFALSTAIETVIPCDQSVFRESSNRILSEQDCFGGIELHDDFDVISTNYQWLQSRSENGAYEAINGADKPTLNMGEIKRLYDSRNYDVAKPYVRRQETRVYENITTSPAATIRITAFDLSDTDVAGIFQVNKITTIFGTVVITSTIGTTVTTLTSTLTNISRENWLPGLTSAESTTTVTATVTFTSSSGNITSRTVTSIIRNGDNQTAGIRYVKGNLLMGAIYSVNLFKLSNNFGAVPPEWLTYEWQVGDGTTFKAVANNQGNPSYTLRVSDFADNSITSTATIGVNGERVIIVTPSRYLRAVVTDRTGSWSNEMILDRLNIDAPTEGQLSINTNQAESPLILTASVDELTDGNGIGTFAYQWFTVIDNITTTIAGATENTYTFNPSDEGGQQVHLEVRHTDPFGFANYPPLRAEFDYSVIGVVASLDEQIARITITDNENVANPNSYTYAWQQSNSPNSGYTPIGGANQSTYTIPQGAQTYLRASVGFAILGSDVVTRSAISNPIFLKVTRGNLRLSGSGRAAGSTYEIDVSDVIDLLGVAVPAASLRFQWQTGDGTTWQNIARATAQTYNLNTSDFARTRQQLRGLAANKIGGTLAMTLESNAVIIQAEVGGNASINTAANADGFVNAAGAMLIADTSRLTDENGLVLSYQWYYRAVGDNIDIRIAPIRNATNASYVILPTDFQTPNADSYFIQLRVQVGDAFDFNDTTQTVEYQLLKEDTTATIVLDVLDVDPFVSGNHLTANLSAVRAPNGVSDTNYQWFGVSADGTPTALPTPITASIFVLNNTWNTAHISVYVVATVVSDIYGISTDFTSSVLLVDQPTEGTALLTFVNDVFPIMGSTVQANVSAITDDNNGAASGTFTYLWKSHANVSLGAEQTYIFTAADIAAIDRGELLSLVVTHEDSLGFQTTRVLKLRDLVRVEITIANGVVESDVIDSSDQAIASTYQYQWLQGDASGNYVPIDRATLSNYAVPNNFDSTRPRVRLSVSYELRRDRSIRNSSESNIVTVAGINPGGSIVIAGNDVAVGSYWNADVSGLRNVLDRAPSPQELSYQWQSSTTENSGYQNISGATSPSYQLQPEGFEGERKYLRVQVTDASGERTDAINSPAVDVSRPLAGNVTIQGVIARNGDILTAVDTFRDENGLGVSSYQWQRRLIDNSVQPISQATMVTYTLTQNDFVDMRLMEVIVTNKDALSFATTLTATSGIIVERAAASGSITIDASQGYNPDSSVAANASAIVAGNGTRAVQYSWDRGRSSNQTFVSIAVTSREFSLQNWDSQYDLLRLRVIHTDLLGRTVTFVSAPLSVDRPFVGTVALVQANDGNPLRGLFSGLRVSANADKLRDPNNSGVGRITNAIYQWIDAEGVTLPNGTSQIYVLTQTDAETGGISLRFSYVDDLRFSSTLIVALIGNVVEIEQYKSLTRVINAIVAQQGIEAVGVHLGRSSSPSTRQNFSATEFRLHINDVEVQEGSQMAAAFANRASDSVHTNTPFALDSFALAASGGKSSSRWSSWVEGQWSKVEGNPKVGDDVLSYRGDSMGLYGGIDRTFGGWRLGLAAGIQSSEIDVPLGRDGVRNDKIMQEMLSVFPYLEWREQGLLLRAMGGWGSGEAQLKEGDDNGCSATMDAETRFGGFDGALLVSENKYWDLNLNAALQTNESTIDGGNCIGLTSSEIPGVDTSSTAASFGMRASFGKNGNVHPFMLADVRKTFGDLSSTAYDFGLGLEMLRGGWSVNAEGRIQLNESEHRRHSIRGALLYSGDNGYRVQWNADVERKESTAATMDMVNKWQIGRLSEWGVNTINSGLYYELRNNLNGGVAQEKAGVEIKIDFLMSR